MLKFVAGEKSLSVVEEPDVFKKRLKRRRQVSCWKNLYVVDF